MVSNFNNLKRNKKQQQVSLQTSSEPAIRGIYYITKKLRYFFMISYILSFQDMFNNIMISQNSSQANQRYKCSTMNQQFLVTHTLAKQTDFYVKAQYQYELERTADAIFNTISTDFLLPCWVQRYEIEQNKVNTINYLNMLDCKSIKINPITKEWDWVQEDKQELIQMALLKNYSTQWGDKKEAEIYKEAALNLYEKWQGFKQFLKIIINDDKSYFKEIQKSKKIKVQDSILKLYIFERIYRYPPQSSNSANKESKNQQFLGQTYYLIRYNGRHQGKYYKEDNLFVFQNSPQKFETNIVNVSISLQSGIDLNYDTRVIYYNIPENQQVKRLEILIEFTDQNNFFKKQLKIKEIEIGSRKLQCFKNIFYKEIEPLQSRNKIVYPYQQCKFQRNKINLYKSFHLAFQGGGAKGIAYVGAYKSIRETKQNDKRVPVKSIMGSSAGGIIALAISTGIPEYQLQKICYKMNEIPLNDRFVPNEEGVVALDDYGNEISMEKVKNSLIQILDQYGILQKELVQSLFNFIQTDEHSKQFQDKLLHSLAIASPSMAQMLTLYSDDQVKVKNNFITDFFSSKTKTVTRRRINWEGLVVHGALMKGEAIYDIAKDCLVKFFLQESIHRDEVSFKNFLKESLQPERNMNLVQQITDFQGDYHQINIAANREDSQKLKKQKRPEQLRFQRINKYLNAQITLGRSLLQLTLEEIYKALKQAPTEEKIQLFKAHHKQTHLKEQEIAEIIKNESFGVYIIAVINRFIVLIDKYLRLEDSSKGLLLGNTKNKNLINIQMIPFKKQKKGLSLRQYFFESYKEQKAKQLKQKRQNDALHEYQYNQLVEQNKQIQAQLSNQLLSQEKEALSYSEINSILNRNNFINPQDLDLLNIFSQLRSKGWTLIQLMNTIFDGQINQIDIAHALRDTTEARFQQNPHQTLKQKDTQINQLFHSIEAAESIYEIYLLAKQQRKELFIPIIQKYERNLRRFQHQVSKINTLQFYRLTKIELTCTSVDLDNKVLRFFNHITTPDLPVCRQVQMTGSFPVGFKAQKWRKQWGFYNVYLLEQKLQINITGHQFTDGGLLANFPIKYMDNEMIRMRYFSHKAIKGETILLGFGLDFLGPEKYELTQKQTKKQIQKQKQIHIAGVDLKNIFGASMVLDLLKGWWQTQKQKQVVHWNEIEHYLINQIPLLRFGIKIANAYPNADRNLNLQAFENKVLHQEMNSQWQLNQVYIENKRVIKKSYIKEAVGQYRLHLDQKYKKQLKPIQISDKDTSNELFGKINFYINSRQDQLIERAEIVKAQYLKEIKQNGTFIYNYHKKKENLQSVLTEKLIWVFFIQLKMKCNKNIVNKYGNCYAFMKFIAEDFKSKIQKHRILNTSQKLTINKDLNKLNFNSLFNEQKYQEIANHLGFQNYHTQYYKQLVKYLQQKDTHNIEDYRKYEIEFRNKKRGQTQKHLENDFKSEQFYDLKLFDVTESVKRLTQLIFLLIRGRDKANNHKDNKLKSIEDIRKITKYLKNTPHQELFLKKTDSNLTSNLTFNEVMQFMKDQINSFKDKKQNFTILHSFYLLVTQYSSENPYKIYSQYLRIMLFHHDNHTVNLKSIESKKNETQLVASQGFRKWFQREYNFIIKYKSKQKIKAIMKQLIARDINDKIAFNQKNKQKHPSAISKLIYKIIFGKEPKISKTQQTQQTRKDVDVLTCIDSLLIFVYDEQNFNQVFDLSQEQEKFIFHHKQTILNTLSFLIRDYNSSQSTKVRQIDLLKNVKTFEVFLGQISSKYNELLQQHQLQKNIEDMFSGWLTDNYAIKDSKKQRQYLFNNQSLVHKQILNFIQSESLRICLQSKLRVKQYQLRQQGENSYELYKIDRLIKLKTQYFYDMKFIVANLKEMMFLLRSIPKSQQNPNSHENTLHNYSFQVLNMYRLIIGEFVRKYLQLQGKSLNNIDQSDICQAFIIEFKHIYKLSHEIYPLISELYFKNRDVPFNKLSRNQKVVQYVYNIMSKVIRHKFSIPLLDIDWDISTESNLRFYREKVSSILAHQINSKNNNFEKTIEKENQSSNFQGTEGRIKIDESVHLILEGVQSSNQYFGGLYQNVNQILQKFKCKVNKQQQQIHYQTTEVTNIQKIKAITCSNFHSIFGFLLSMGYSNEFIRTQMFKLKYITNSMEKQVQTNELFDSMQWANNNSQRHKDLFQFLDKQNHNFFNQIEKLRSKDYDYTTLSQQIYDIKLIFEHERKKMIEVYQKIIDQTVNSLEFIEGSFTSTQYPLQISKKFGFDYTCSIEHDHTYKVQSQKSFDLFKKIATKLYDTFGSLLYGIISNSLSSHTAIAVTVENAKYVAKGLLISRLLTTFKLQDYIKYKLKQARLSPSISLSQFYQVSQRKIFLNFTVVDVNRQMVVFLNKNTMPNMPLWAALIATSSLPFFHQFFQANKEWEATDSKSFYQYFVYQFFKAEHDHNTRITKYMSGNFISSVPLQLITNNTIRNKIFDPILDKNLSQISQYAVCFKPSSVQNNKIINVKIEKNYFNIDYTLILKLLGNKVTDGIKGIPGSIVKHFQSANPHQNNNYNISYSPISYLGDWLGTSTLMTTFNVLSNSNDNLIMKWYYNKLIKLPIKLDTLDFHQILDLDYLRKYKVNVLAEKAKQTVERSYELTKHFTFKIIERVSDQIFGKGFQYQRSSVIKELPEDQKDIFTAKLRAEIIERPHKNTGFIRKYLKVNFLNHTKWNHNNFNNYVVEYRVIDGKDTETKPFKRVNQSEVTWLVQSNTKIQFKFYYLLLANALQKTQPGNYGEPIVTKLNKYQIRYTRIDLDFKELVDTRVFSDSYDYEFHYGWKEDQKIQFFQRLNPKKRNGYQFTEKLGNEKGIPSLIAKLVNGQQEFKSKNLILPTSPIKSQ